MAKQSGITYAVSVGDVAGTPRVISNDVTGITIASPRGTQDVTGLDKSAFERLLLLADTTVTITGVYNTAALTGSHTVLKTIPTSTTVVRPVTLTPLGGSALTVNCIGTDYTLTRAQSGELTFSATFMLADGAVPTWS